MSLRDLIEGRLIVRSSPTSEPRTLATLSTLTLAAPGDSAANADEGERSQASRPTSANDKAAKAANARAPGIDEAVTRGKLDALLALLERGGYIGHPARAPARLRRDLTRSVDYPSLRAMKADTAAWARASAVVDEWIARLADDVRRGPLS